jgi:hypothetical protein
MPAALADGGPFVLCGFGLTSHAQMSHGSHHDHKSAMDQGSPEGTPEDTWKACPLGALSATSAVASDFFLVFEYRKAVFTANSDFGTFVQPPIIKYRSRAPPVQRSTTYLN